jgi:hypothetical protein
MSANLLESCFHALESLQNNDTRSMIGFVHEWGQEEERGGRYIKDR